MSDHSTNTGAGGFPPPALSGQVIDAATGAPVPDAIVSFEGDSPTHIDMGQITNAAGGFRYPRLAPGDYDLSVRAPDGRTATLRATVTAGAPVEVTITLDTQTGGDDDPAP